MLREPIVEVADNVGDEELCAPLVLVALLSPLELHLFPGWRLDDPDAEAMFTTITEDEYGPALFYKLRKGDVRDLYFDLQERGYAGDEYVVHVHGQRKE